MFISKALKYIIFAAEKKAGAASFVTKVANVADNGDDDEKPAADATEVAAKKADVAVKKRAYRGDPFQYIYN